MLGPAAPNGPQKWLQQSPQPLQTVPSIWQLVEMLAQVPAGAPAAIEQTPVQHSPSPRQMSPVCAQ
jgi:hypothetical protein